LAKGLRIGEVNNRVVGMPIEWLDCGKRIAIVDADPIRTDVYVAQ
jgi:hypothetical protein